MVYRSDSDEKEDWQALAAREYLKEQASHLGGFQTEIVLHESSRGPEIVEQAEKHDADIIVMGSHGRSGVKRWILGSVAESVVQRAHCPVFVVHSPHS